MFGGSHSLQPCVGVNAKQGGLPSIFVLLCSLQSFTSLTSLCYSDDVDLSSIALSPDVLIDYLNSSCKKTFRSHREPTKVKWHKAT